MLKAARAILSLLSGARLFPDDHPRWGRLPAKDRLAARGEFLAERRLRRRGYRILARRWRWHRLELDLVALKGNVVAVVEVKTRRDDSFGAPQEAVPHWKRRRIVLAGQAFVKAGGLHDRFLRFDVFAVTIPPAGKPVIDHIENAFSR